jgi:hypothetical protein
MVDPPPDLAGAKRFFPFFGQPIPQILESEVQKVQSRRRGNSDRMNGRSTGIGGQVGVERIGHEFSPVFSGFRQWADGGDFFASRYCKLWRRYRTAKLSIGDNSLVIGPVAVPLATR